MPHRRLHRRLIAWLLAFCVVFAQSAAVAYACQRQALPDADAGNACPTHLAQGAAADSTPADRNVCEVHCQDASLPDAGPADAPVTGALVAWTIALPSLALAPSAPAAELEAKSAAPPPRTLYARLLI